MTTVISGDTGITFPDGTTQTAAATLPPGVVLHFANATPPSGWLSCNGAAVSRTTYAALFTAIGTIYGAGDSITTFNVPDLRGEFIRGWDNGRGVDTGRAVGSSQAGQMPSHQHLGTTGTVNTYGSATGGGGGYGGAGPGTADFTRAEGGTNNNSENRPRNVAMLPCIKT